MIDLARYRSTLGDPSAFFVDAGGRSLPLVVRHATGLAEFEIAGETLRPYVKGPGPSPDSSAGFTAQGAGFRFQAVVTPPSPISLSP